MNHPPLDTQTQALIRLAVEEDVGSGDRTVLLAIGKENEARGTIVARKAGVLAGGYLLPAICEHYGSLRVTPVTGDGERLSVNQAAATIAGNARALLSAERVCLNFLGHLSGIATLTRRYVDAVAQVTHPPAICDTRKTTPGFRVLDKYAVRCGGGTNHRMGLYDGVMLKDNHLAAMRAQLSAKGGGHSLFELTRHIRGILSAEIPLWLEVDTLEQLREALPTGDEGGADILLDNFTAGQIGQAVAMRNAAAPSRAPLLEASGGITLETVAEFAAAGVDRISIGALTHSAGGLDLSMEVA